MKHSISYQNLSVKEFEKADRLFKQHRNKLNKYLDLLFWWNKKINLFSRNVSRETFRQHIHHCLLISSFKVFKDKDLLVDAGTGGGLPGLPLAIAHPGKQFVLNDIVSKKIMAVKQMGKELSLNNIKTADKSIDELQIDEEFLLVSKHAFKIKDLYKFTVHLPWSAIVLYKSVDVTAELEGIMDPLEITIYKLYPNRNNPFYKGKGIVIIKR